MSKFMSVHVKVYVSTCQSLSQYMSKFMSVHVKVYVSTCQSLSQYMSYWFRRLFKIVNTNAIARKNSMLHNFATCN